MRILILAVLSSLTVVLLGAPALAQTLPRMSQDVVAGCDTDFTTSDLSRQYPCANGDHLVIVSRGNVLQVERVRPQPGQTDAFDFSVRQSFDRPAPAATPTAFIKPPAPYGVDPRMWVCHPGRGNLAHTQRCTPNPVWNAAQQRYEGGAQSQWFYYYRDGTPMPGNNQPQMAPAPAPQVQVIAAAPQQPLPEMQNRPSVERVVVQTANGRYEAIAVRPPTTAETVTCILTLTIVCPGAPAVGAAYSGGYDYQNYGGNYYGPGRGHQRCAVEPDPRNYARVRNNCS